jgi:type IV pilus assembly protein PilC
MAETYVYRVRDSRGTLLRGSLEGDSLGSIVTRLREMGYIPLSVDKKASTALSKDFKLPFVGNKVKQEELGVFSRQFATMIDAGMTLLRSISILAEQSDNPVLAETLRNVRMDVEQGAALSQALSRHPKVFPPIYVAMVKAGEIGGGLDEVLLRLADTLEKQVALRRKIKSAMTYPVAVACLVGVILTAMLVFIVPTFKSIFASLGGKLPLPTLLLVKISDGAVVIIPLTLVLAVIATFAIRKWIAKPKGRHAWDAMKLRIPLFGKLVHRTAIARMARTLSSLVKAGVPLLDSLEITKDTAGNAIVADALGDVQDGISRGESINRRLANHPVIPPMVAQMVSVGEESGSVDTMLEKVALFYEGQVEALVSSLSSLLEPIMVAFLGGIVGSMVISLYLPMFSIINQPGLNS